MCLRLQCTVCSERNVQFWEKERPSITYSSFIFSMISYTCYIQPINIQSIYRKRKCFILLQLSAVSIHRASPKILPSSFQSSSQSLGSYLSTNTETEPNAVCWQYLPTALPHSGSIHCLFLLQLGSFTISVANAFQLSHLLLVVHVSFVTITALTVCARRTNGQPAVHGFI